MQANNFIITINNPTQDVHQVSELVKAAGFKHFRGQLEKGDSGTLHIQATFGGKKHRILSLKKLFPLARIEIARSPIDAWNYCGKEDTRVEPTLEWGIP